MTARPGGWGRVVVGSDEVGPARVRSQGSGRNSRLYLFVAPAPELRQRPVLSCWGSYGTQQRRGGPQPPRPWPSIALHSRPSRARLSAQILAVVANKIGVHYALQKLVKSAWAQWACIIACWCWPVQMKQFPFDDFFAPVPPHRASLSQTADGEHDAGPAGGGSHDRRRAAAPPGTRRRWQ